MAYCNALQFAEPSGEFAFQPESYKRDKFWKEVLGNLQNFPKFKLVNNFLYRGKQLCVPRSKHKEVLKRAHDAPSSGHPGVNGTQKRVARHFYWHGMYKDINDYVLSCHICHKTKPGTRLKSLPQPLPVAPRPWHTVTMDLITGLPQVGSFNAVYVFVDKYSKMVQIVRVSDTITAQGCIEVFYDSIYKNFGLPEVLISDRDPRFTADVYKLAMKQFNVHVKMTTPGHAQTDGQTERMNRVIKQMLMPRILVSIPIG